jgi:chromate reductase, NAD(P)H dehydrogenase (quinone)
MITIICGTNRPGSNTRKITSHVEKIYESLEVVAQVLDLALLPSEIFSPSSYEKSPASFKRFINDILHSDGLVVITPEYNGSIPGVLKYFIDMLPFPESFDQRPVCFVGLAAGLWGALRPAEQLQQIFAYRNGIVFPERVFLPGVNSLFEESGKLNPRTEKSLREQAIKFVSFVEKVQEKSLSPRRPKASSQASFTTQRVSNP